MKLALSIAKRYLIAKKSQNIINIISMISVAGILTGSMALLVVLSVFNGLHGFVGSLYNTFDPDLQIVPKAGKVFSVDSIPLDRIKSLDGVVAVSEIVEDNALLKFGKRQMPGVVMGVDTIFSQVTEIDSIMDEGVFNLNKKGENRGVLGMILADQLAVRLNFVTPLVMYVPRRTGHINMANPQNAFNMEYLRPSGIFLVKQMEYDANYILVNIDQARRLYEYDGSTVSSLKLRIDDYENMPAVKKQLGELLGDHFRIKNREEQHESFYKMMKVEKLMAYLILSFIMMIAAFNVIGTLSMLIYEKKESIFTLRSLGADRKLITRIFLVEGWMISLLGVFGGLILGAVIVWLQQTFGLLKFQGMGSFIVDAYPVELQFTDVLAVLVTVSTIGFLAAWYPVRVIVRGYYSSYKE
ncbi:FtsX-like permease family protein [Marinilabiliaceae bacterium JC017]|nr:FtsX-like permease family protein [Marinilabiliaceae bacterium JC017]